MVRQEWQYDQVFRDENKKYAFTYLYEANGQPQGYFTYRGGSKENTRLREFIALTPEAQRGLLGLLHRHEMQIDKFSWAAPADDSLWSLQYHWDIDTRLEPFAQARIVDAPAALQGWRPEPGQEGVVILKLHDPVCDWNEGVWRIEFGGGEVSVARTEAEPQVSMDIQALTQLYFGWPTPEMLRHSGRLKVQEEMGLIALTSLLHGPTFWLNNHF
jgi:predicted acetyltransferase